MKDDGTPLFWLIKQSDRVELMNLYHKLSGGKVLPISQSKPPWEEKQKPLDIPVNEDSEELERLMQQPPRIEGRGGY
uniref:Uncharacterized protein n=1 Tax=viral metagenome TaxID=1070528 RepID=A0A6M3L3I9_9ZZZZ